MAFDTDNDDIMADVAAAVRGESGGEGEGASPPAAPASSEPAPALISAPARDAAGKFAPRGSEPQQPAVPPSAAAQPAQEGTAAQEPVRPPASWSPQAKADFAALPPHVQQEVLKREKDIDAGRAQWETKAQLANRFEELFASRKDRLAMAGMDPIQAVQRLLAAQDILDRDPRAGILTLAQAYGIHPSQLVQASGQQQPPQAQLPPALQGLLQEVATLKQTLTQQSQAQADAARARHTESIQQFAADPKNLYFENVRGDMAALLNDGRASTLEQAYEMAIWANPEIRPLLLKQQQTGALASASAKVSKARSAGGSVTGSPTPGSSPAQQSNPNSSVEDDVRAAFASLGSRA